MPDRVCVLPSGFPGCGLKRDGLRPRGDCRPHTPEPRPAVHERARLRHQQRPPRRFLRREGAAFRAVQRAAVQGPARPVPRQRAEIAQAQDAQQSHHRPRHPAAPGFPVGHRAQAHPEKRSRRLAAQQAGPAQLAKAVRADMPQTPGRPRRAGFPGAVQHFADFRICILCKIRHLTSLRVGRDSYKNRQSHF